MRRLKTAVSLRSHRAVSPRIRSFQANGAGDSSPRAHTKPAPFNFRSSRRLLPPGHAENIFHWRASLSADRQAASATRENVLTRRTQGSRGGAPRCARQAAPYARLSLAGRPRPTPWRASPPTGGQAAGAQAAGAAQNHRLRMAPTAFFCCRRAGGASGRSGARENPAAPQGRKGCEPGGDLPATRGSQRLLLFAVGEPRQRVVAAILKNKCRARF